MMSKNKLIILLALQIHKLLIALKKYSFHLINKQDLILDFLEIIKLMNKNKFIRTKV